MIIREQGPTLHATMWELSRMRELPGTSSPKCGNCLGPALLNAGTTWAQFSLMRELPGALGLADWSKQKQAALVQLSMIGELF